MECKLYDYQVDTVYKLKSGKILCGKVGSGKTLTALAFYFLNYDCELVVITTAKKRDSGDWEKEAKLIGVDHILVDSWNNIKKYANKTNCFFIFDEQKISGFGAWAKSFIKITKVNDWILLSATPGDTWSDYISVFVANGFYKNKTDFTRQHVEYDRFAKYPKVRAYHNQGKLTKLRNKIVVTMEGASQVKRRRLFFRTSYDKELYLKSLRTRWNYYDDKPIENGAQMTQIARRVVGTSDGRAEKVKDILLSTNRIICFYNYTYELEVLETVCKEINKPYSQWNGKKHEEIIDGDEWAYIVQYNASEAWNCIKTDSMLFYSMNYSYRVMEQAEGRIDRANTPYKQLYYYYLLSSSSIDDSILRALRSKKKFNEEIWGRDERKRLSEPVDKEA
jgi:hypothetical protein